MKLNIKLVPLAEPNADGEWREVEVDPMRYPPRGTGSWLTIEAALQRAGAVPEGYMVVAVQAGQKAS
jgi:hypothetical protein